MISEWKFTNHNCKCPFILVFMLLLMLTIKTLHRMISRLKHRQNINIENMKHTNIVITSTFQINLRKHQPCIDPISKPLGPAWFLLYILNRNSEDDQIFKNPYCGCNFYSKLDIKESFENLTISAFLKWPLESSLVHKYLRKMSIKSKNHL